MQVARFLIDEARDTAAHMVRTPNHTMKLVLNPPPLRFHAVLHLAIRRGHMQVVRFLIEEAGDTADHGTAPHEGNLKPLHFAVSAGMW